MWYVICIFALSHLLNAYISHRIHTRPRVVSDPAIDTPAFLRKQTVSHLRHNITLAPHLKRLYFGLWLVERDRVSDYL